MIDRLQTRPPSTLLDAPAATVASAAQPARTLVRTLVIVITAAGFAFRVAALSTYGFSEDESAKLAAIDAYERGDFTANAEHPMLMKLAMWGSLRAADAWNAAVPARAVAPESALRLPNVLAGTATVAAVYALVRVLFGVWCGLAAAAFVALDPNVTALNRIGKEDTLMLLFLVLAMWCYERAKVIGARDPAAAQRWYNGSGALWGLMFASKYVPWFFGMYALFNVAAERRPGANRPRPLVYNGLIAIVFLAANAAILLPGTWTYLAAYVRGDRLLHHGYVYAGSLYVNPSTPALNGVPLTYYLHLIVTKAPLPVLALGAAGLVPLVRRRGDRAFVWLRILLLLPILFLSFFGSKFQRYALPMLVMVDVLAAVGLVAVSRAILASARPRAGRLIVAGLTVVALLWLGGAQVRAMPFYSVYQNALGAAAGPPARTFPEEAYDYGVREAIREIAAAAPPDAAVASDASLVVDTYLRRANRRDLEVRSLSKEGMRARGAQYVLVQDGHTYFENAAVIADLRRRSTPWRVYRLRGTIVLEVFRVVR